MRYLQNRNFFFFIYIYIYKVLPIIERIKEFIKEGVIALRNALNEKVTWLIFI